MSAQAPQPAARDQAAPQPFSQARPHANTPLQLSGLPDPCTSTEVAAVLGKSPKTIVDWCQERA